MNKFLLGIYMFALCLFATCSIGCNNHINSGDNNENNQATNIVNHYANLEDASFAQLNVISYRSILLLF